MRFQLAPNSPSNQLLGCFECIVELLFLRTSIVAWAIGISEGIGYIWFGPPPLRKFSRDTHRRWMSVGRSRTILAYFSLLHVVLAGLWCHGVACSESTCTVSDLFDSATTASVGHGALCGWKDDTTVLVTFGQGGGFVYSEEYPFPFHVRLTQVPVHPCYICVFP